MCILFACNTKQTQGPTCKKKKRCSKQATSGLKLHKVPSSKDGDAKMT